MINILKSCHLFLPYMQITLKLFFIYIQRWGIAWTFEPNSELNLTAAPVIRTRAEVSKMRNDKSMEIIFPARENLSCLDQVVVALKTWITELKVYIAIHFKFFKYSHCKTLILQIKIKEIQLDDDDYPCWACQLIGFNDTWSHARRKRRMAMRQEALKKQRIDNPDSSNEIDKLQSDESGSAESEIKSTESNEPLLVCTLLVGEKSEHVDDSDDAEDDSEKDTNDENMLRICMLFESGTGGKLSLETLRQYLVNKLNIRDFFHKKNPSKPNKKKRKRKKIKKDVS